MPQYVRSVALLLVSIGLSQAVVAQDTKTVQVTMRIDAVSPAREAVAHLQRAVSGFERLRKSGAVSMKDHSNSQKLLAEAKLQLAVVENRYEDVVAQLRLLATLYDADVRRAHQVRSRSTGVMTDGEVERLERAAADVHARLASAEKNADDLIRRLSAIVALDEKSVLRAEQLAAKNVMSDREVGLLQLQLSLSRHQLSKAMQQGVQFTQNPAEQFRLEFPTTLLKSSPSSYLRGFRAPSKAPCCRN